MSESGPEPDIPIKESPRGGTFSRWLADHIIRTRSLRQWVPKSVRRMAARLLVRGDVQEELWREVDPCADAEEVSTYPARVDVRLGIVKEPTHAHKYYIGACRDLGVPYRLVDLSGPDWIRVVQESGCQAFLVRPSAHLTVWKQMFDERLKVMVEALGQIIYPTYEEIWFYESKRRMNYWLTAHNVPHPRTWIFYSRDHAMDFGRTVPLPIVAKTDLGSGASGVRIFRRRPALMRWVARCFGRGVVVSDPRDRQWGSVLLQEYLPDAAEWRVIRLGRSYFAHQKLKEGDFHSGSGKVGWYRPPDRLLDFARAMTEKGRFTSMGMDIFETTDGIYLVNELQSLFGSYLPYQMRVDGKPGRFLYDEATGRWNFEEGVFNQNGSCTLRVEALLAILGKRLQAAEKGGA